MAGEEFVPKDQYRGRVQKERKSLLIQVGVLIALSAALSLAFFVTISGATTAAQ